MKRIFLLIFMYFLTNIMTQLSETFTLKARNTEYGTTLSIAVGSDEIVFLANTQCL